MEVWLMVFAVLLVSLLYPTVLGNTSSLLLMLPVVGYTFWFYVDWQMVSVSELALICVGGIVMGVALFAAGLPISTGDAHGFLSDSLRGLRSFISKREHLPLFSYQALFILYEELIWRVFLTHALLPVLSAWLVILLSASLFWFVHADNRSKGGHSVEFFLFSLALAAIFIYSESLLLAWIIHAIRNLLILSGGNRVNAPFTQQENK